MTLRDIPMFVQQWIRLIRYIVSAPQSKAWAQNPRLLGYSLTPKTGLDGKLLFFRTNTEHLGATWGACPLNCRFTILHRDALMVRYFFLSFAFHAVSYRLIKKSWYHQFASFLLRLIRTINYSFSKCQYLNNDLFCDLMERILPFSRIILRNMPYAIYTFHKSDLLLIRQPILT